MSTMTIDLQVLRHANQKVASIQVQILGELEAKKQEIVQDPDRTAELKALTTTIARLRSLHSHSLAVDKEIEAES